MKFLNQIDGAKDLVQDSNNRLVTDTEKSTWNSKSDTDTVTTVNGKTGAIAKADIVALGIPAQDTVYTHPATHPASMITDLPTGKKVVRFVVGTSTAGWTTVDCDYLCDGTDDETEINAAIIALPATGGEVVILDGTYNITDKVDVTKDNVSIRGNGNATILKRMYDSFNGEGVIMLAGRSGCKISNLQVDGNAHVGFGIRLDSSSNNTVTGNTCTSNDSSGIGLISSSNNTITGNTSNNNGDGGIFIYDSSNNNTVTSNTCDNNGVGINLVNSSYANTITGNTCNNNGTSGLYLNNSENNTITGNTSNNNDYGLRIDMSSNNTVTGNIYNNNDHGIFLYSSNNNTITGNTCIRGTGLATDYTESQHTIRLRYADSNYNLISNNNCMGKAPVIEGGTGNSVYGNKYDSGDYKDFTQDEKTKLAGVAASANNYAHPTTAGNKHIPTGGASGQILRYSASGTAIWGVDNDTITTVNGKTGAITKADITALGIPAQDTVYTHPANHPASIITQNASNRFVTDTEKATWNAKGTSNLTLGTTSLTAFRGDYGNTAYAHSQSTHAPSGAQVNQTLTSGNGMAAWTATNGNLTIPLGTPSTLTTATTNAVTTTSHTHSVTFPVTSVAGKTGAVTLGPTDVGAAASTHSHGTYDRATAALTGANVFSDLVIDDGIVTGTTTRALTPANIGAAAATHTHSYVPTSRTVNGKALSANIALTAADVGAAATSHGNHVPTTETANNAIFLRNDNSWQTVTPANIGAATAAHTHTTWDRASSVLTGANVFSNIVVTNGITTAISTRALTLANLGYTGATNANYYTHPASHPASMITESPTKRFVSDLEKTKWDDYYRGNWDRIQFTVNGDADTYYPVALTGLNMNEAIMSLLEIYRAHSWTAPDTWNTPTHKGGLNLSIDYSLAGWGGQNYELQLTLSQTYSRMVADVITALPDTSMIIVWLRGGTALYELRRQSKGVQVTVYDGVQGILPFKYKEGTQHENIYDSKIAIEPWFDFIGIKKLLTTEGRLYIGGGYRNPKNSVEIYHENNKPTKVDVGLGNVDNTSDLNKPISTATQVALSNKVDSSRVLTNVPANAKFTDTIYSHPTTAGNKHIPTGGASGQVLKYSASGTATWQADNDTITTINGKTGAIAKADIVALGIPAQDTVYTHPASHPASIITQNASNRFVTDAEKAAWNAKGTSNLALGTTSSTAYRGDYGNTAYTHSQATHAPTNAVANQTLTSGSGMAAWTATSGNLTITLGTPSTLTTATTNAVTTTSHTHSITFPVTSVAGKTGAVTLGPTDVGAAPSSHTHAYVPTSRTVNGKALSANITLTAANVGAAASSHSHNEINSKSDYSIDGTTAQSTFSRVLQANFINSGGPESTYHTFLTVSGYSRGGNQVSFPYGSNGNMWWRASNYSTDTWYAWRKLLDSSNYNSYAPTLTGTGASGSWGISVTGSSASCTGNAASATKAATLTTARTLTIGSTGKTFNGSANVSWSLAEIGAAPASHTHSYVPTTRTVNSKALSANITLTAADVGAAATSHGNHVPTTGTANSAIFLRNDNTWQTVTPANIGAAPSSHTHAYVPTSRTVNGKALSANISLTAADVGASASGHTHSYLPLSGGTLTGKVSFGAGINSQSVDGKSMNTITETGFYYGYNMTNAAVTAISTFIVNKYSPDWIDQIQIITGAVPQMYIRSRHSGTTWGSWKNITKPAWSDVTGKPTTFEPSSHTHSQVGGYGVSTTAGAANTIPVRDSSGYMRLGWINTPSGSVGNVQPYYIYSTNTASDDNFIRKIPFTNLADRINGYGSAKNSHKSSYVQLLSPTTLAGNTSVTFTDSGQHNMYAVYSYDGTSGVGAWACTIVPATTPSSRYFVRHYPDCYTFKFGRSGTTCTLTRDSSTAIQYAVYAMG